MALRLSFMLAASFVVISCSALAQSFSVTGTAGNSLTANVISEFDEPWAMTFIDRKNMLVTTKGGELWVVKTDGQKRQIEGLPEVSYGGQGGLGDVVPAPGFLVSNSYVYLSYVEADPATLQYGAVVVRGSLNISGTPRLENLERIWTQTPKNNGRGHFSHRLAFGPAGSVHEGKLFITSGDRQLQTPSQDMNQSLGKVIRLNLDGSMPADNPYQDQGELAKSFWSVGHRNPLGIAFDQQGRLWSSEMGPKHGDELNLIEPGQNYGWPLVSNGDQYSGVEIPDHDTRPDFAAPKAYWVPSIAPSGLVMYFGEAFPVWQGDAFIGGLRSRAVIRVDIQGDQAREAERFEWGKRIREVEQGPAGNLWVLEDGGRGRLIRLSGN